MAFSTVGEAWESYRKEVLRTDNQRILSVIRDAFYAGCLSGLGILCESPTEIDELEVELMDYLRIRRDSLGGSNSPTIVH